MNYKTNINITDRKLHLQKSWFWLQNSCEFCVCSPVLTAWNSVPVDKPVLTAFLCPSSKPVTILTSW